MIILKTVVSNFKAKIILRHKIEAKSFDKCLSSPLPSTLSKFNS